MKRRESLMSKQLGKGLWRSRLVYWRIVGPYWCFHDLVTVPRHIFILRHTQTYDGLFRLCLIYFEIVTTNSRGYRLRRLPTYPHDKAIPASE